MKILQFLQDDTGALSATRLVLVTWSLGLLTGVLYLTHINKAFPSVDPSIVGLFGIAVGGKVMQSFSENK